MNSEHLDTLKFPKIKALKAKKRTIQNPLFLSEEVTLHYQRSKSDRRLAAFFFFFSLVNQSSLVLCLFPSKGLAFWLFVATLLWYLYSQRTSVLMLAGICNIAGHWSLWSLQGIKHFGLQIPCGHFKELGVSVYRFQALDFKIGYAWLC